MGEGKQVIVFRETKGEARGCAGYLAERWGCRRRRPRSTPRPGPNPSRRVEARCAKPSAQGVAFHTSDLDRDERLVIEEQFRAPGTTLRVIAATTTLAMGVNTPAEAVVIAGLMHPGDKPYSVAEYKNIVGRAGRLGFSDGDVVPAGVGLRERAQRLESVREGMPEDLHSRFVAEGTDPRTLILRVLAAARKAKVKGIPAADVIDFLEGSFGAFQKRHGGRQLGLEPGGALRGAGGAGTAPSDRDRRGWALPADAARPVRRRGGSAGRIDHPAGRGVGPAVRSRSPTRS